LTHAVVQTRVGTAGIADLAQVALEAVLARAADRISVGQAGASVGARIGRTQVS
jgi:hypothetical protein